MNRFASLVVIVHLVAGTAILAQLLDVDLRSWSGGSLTLCGSLGLMLVAQGLRRRRPMLPSLILASGLVGCLEYIPWLSTARTLDDAWRGEAALIFAGPLGIAIALVLGLLVKWQRDLEHDRASAISGTLLERCSLWMASLCCLCAAVPWTERSTLLVSGSSAALCAVLATGETFATRRQPRPSLWVLTRCLSLVGLLLLLAVALDAFSEMLLLSAHARSALSYFDSLTPLFLCVALAPGLMSAWHRWGFARDGNPTKAVVLPVFVGLLAFGAPLVLVTQGARGDRNVGFVTITVMLLLFWYTPPAKRPDSVPSVKRKAPWWVLSLPVATIAALPAAWWLTSLDYLLQERRAWFLCAAFLLVWHLPLGTRGSEAQSAVVPAPHWLLLLRASSLAVGLLVLARMNFQSPIGRVAVELHTWAILAESRAGDDCRAGKYSTHEYEGPGGYHHLYVARRSGFVTVSCAHPWGCGVAFGKARWVENRIELLLPAAFIGGSQFIALSWHRLHHLIPPGSVAWICEDFNSGDWLKRNTAPISGYEMFPNSKRCASPANFPLRPVLSNDIVRCTLPSPLEAPIVAAAPLTWAAGKRDGAFVGMRLRACDTGSSVVVEEVRETESTVSTLSAHSEIRVGSLLGSLLPCQGATLDYED